MNLAEQQQFLADRLASGEYIRCQAMQGTSIMPETVCLARQKQNRRTWRFAVDQTFSGENLHLECQGCPRNKQRKTRKPGTYQNGAWKKTRGVMGRMEAWARSEGFKSAFEATITLYETYFAMELAKAMGVSDSFFRNCLIKWGIPRHDKRMISRSTRRRSRQELERKKRWKHETKT